MDKKKKARGYVALDLEGETYQLFFNNNALCELEDLLDRPISDFSAGLRKGRNGKVEIIPEGEPGYVPPEKRLDRPSFRQTRAMLWAALLHDPALDGLTLKEAGELIDKAPRGTPAARFRYVYERVLEAFGKAVATDIEDGEKVVHSTDQIPEPEPVVDESGN